MNTMINPIPFLSLSAIRILAVAGITFFLLACQGMPQREDSASADVEVQSIESQIFYESVAAGAAIGAVTGGLIGNQVGEAGAWFGTAAGAVIGGIIGNAYAEQKISEYRDVRLQNDRLQILVQQAQRYNEEISAYNASLQADIAQLQKQNEDDRMRLSQLKLAQAKAKQRAVAERIKERKALRDALVADQSAVLRQELFRLEEEEKILNGHISKYKAMASPVIG